jgi:transcriptional regulator with XRE-family HTH domain
MPDPTPSPSQLFGDRVYGARHARGLSMRALAQLAGISPSPIDRIENGHGCQFDTAARIAAALGITLDEPGRNHPR